MKWAQFNIRRTNDETVCLAISFFSCILFLKSLQISQERTCIVAVIKLQVPQNFIKRRLQTRFFKVKFAKFLKTLWFTELLQWLALTASGFQPATLLKKTLRQKCFAVNFANIFKNVFSFERTPPDDCFLCFSVNFEKFLRTLRL